jgi:ABC-type iron transport system FetAB ATPase subunit
MSDRKMDTECEFNQPKVLQKTDLYPGVFQDDLTFKFEATNVHTTDPKDIEQLFADLDRCVSKFKASLKK